jgi:peroxiredoxin
MSILSPEDRAMTFKTGDKLPDATFRVMTPDGPKEKTTEQVFGGKRVALFAVPGAFTPTCSARHLPGFKDRAADLRAKGIDLIACVSVNDAWVMGAWGDAQGVGDDILMLADGGGEFTRALGLEMDASKFGLGERSQRYSMVVDNCVVEQLNVEGPGQFEVSTADYMVDHL